MIYAFGVQDSVCDGYFNSQLSVSGGEILQLKPNILRLICYHPFHFVHTSFAFYDNFSLSILSLFLHLKWLR